MPFEASDRHWPDDDSRMDRVRGGLEMRACWHIAAVLALAVIAAGCASRQRCAENVCPSAPIAFDCQRVERQMLTADISAVSYQARGGPKQYCNLPERDAQCLAAVYSPQARLLEQEAEAVAAQPSGPHKRDSSWATQQSLRLQAVHERNRNASLALQLLYRIAGAETATDNLREQLEEIKGTLADLRRLEQAGVDLPLSLPQTESQQVEVRHKLGEMDLLLDLLNEQLANLMGVDLPPGHRFWPDIDLRVDPNVPEVENAQMTALAQRADLAALRVAASVGGADVARAVLGVSGLGLSPSGCKLLSLLHLHAKGDETAARDDQLQTGVADKERTIRHEVAQAVATIRARLNLIALFEQRLELLRAHRENMQGKSELTTGGSFEVRRAAAAVLLAQQDVFNDVIEWKTAAAKLREAQGDLAIECGYLDVFNFANCCP